MEDFRATLAEWLDAQVVGPFLLAWSGQIIGALLIFLVGRWICSVNIAVRPWVNSTDYWAVRGDLLERIKRVLEDNGLSIPYPQRAVHIVSQVANDA